VNATAAYYKKRANQIEEREEVRYCRCQQSAVIIAYLEEALCLPLSLLLLLQQQQQAAQGDGGSNHRRHRTTTIPYKRILFMMSVSDLVQSVTTMTQAFWVPASTSPRYWALGNDATCTAVGAKRHVE
jgi:hypothetical protein